MPARSEGNELQRYRERLYDPAVLTARRVAERMKVDAPYVSRLERGLIHEPSEHMVRRYITALGPNADERKVRALLDRVISAAWTR